MREKQLTVTSPLLPDLDEFHQYLKDIWDRRWITNCGQMHKSLEKALAEYLGVEYISLFTNGTLPIMVALHLLGVTGEVITTPFTAPATVHAIWLMGLKPVFVDINPSSCNIDPNRIAEAITPATSAILGVHCYGNPCDVSAIQEIADTHGLKVIYDAAHAFGVKTNGRPLVAEGDISTLSFHATKVYNTIEGGAMVIPDAETKYKVDRLKNFGIADETTVLFPGINAKLDEVRCAYGLLNLKNVDSAISRRKEVSEIYARRLKNVDGVRILDIPEHVERNYAYFPVFIDADKFGMSRDELYETMKAHGIYSRCYFYPLVSEVGAYKNLPSAQPDNLSNAHRAARSVLCLPLHHLLTDDDVNRVLQFF